MWYCCVFFNSCCIWRVAEVIPVSPSPTSKRRCEDWFINPLVGHWGHSWTELLTGTYSTALGTHTSTRWVDMLVLQVTATSSSDGLIFPRLHFQVSPQVLKMLLTPSILNSLVLTLFLFSGQIFGGGKIGGIFPSSIHKWVAKMTLLTILCKYSKYKAPLGSLILAFPWQDSNMPLGFSRCEEAVPAAETVFRQPNECS